MGIIEIEENAKIGDRYKVILQPKLELIGTGTFQFSEESVRGIIEIVDAGYFEWEVSDIRFPIVEGVKCVSMVLTRVALFNQAGQALVVLISGLGGALAFAFIIMSVDKMAEQVTPSPSFSFTILGALALLIGGTVLYLKIR